MIDTIVPLASLLLAGYITYQIYKYVMSLQVVGKPNEWVVVINNGKLKKFGIGETVFKMPGD